MGAEGGGGGGGGEGKRRGGRDALDADFSLGWDMLKREI